MQTRLTIVVITYDVSREIFISYNAWYSNYASKFLVAISEIATLDCDSYLALSFGVWLVHLFMPWLVSLNFCSNVYKIQTCRLLLSFVLLNFDTDVPMYRFKIILVKRFPPIHVIVPYSFIFLDVILIHQLNVQICF